jgi:hypothetical protein
VRLAGDPSRFGPKYFLHTNLDQIGDQERQFWVPLHKLFSGPGCIADCPKLKVRFEAEHVNEKIRRIHLDSMRASIAAATQTVVDLTRVARSAGKVCLVVCANSVAAYATWPSQTAYSKAKRNQADVYETLSIPAIIVHFQSCMQHNVPEVGLYTACSGLTFVLILMPLRLKRHQEFLERRLS